MARKKRSKGKSRDPGMKSGSVLKAMDDSLPSGAAAYGRGKRVGVKIPI